MSRLGRTPIPVPGGVTVTCDAARTVTVKGPKGTLAYRLPEGIAIAIESGKPLRLSATAEDRKLRKFHGLARALVKNMVVGVTEGYVKRLAIAPQTYRAELKGQVLELTVGRANVEKVEIPAGIKIEVGGKGLAVQVSGCDKQLVGEIAARIRRVHPPEPYKGRGIRYEDEVVRRKQGKTLVGGAK